MASKEGSIAEPKSSKKPAKKSAPKKVIMEVAKGVQDSAGSQEKIKKEPEPTVQNEKNNAAKAGKRSAKTQKELDEKLAKEARKVESKDDTSGKKTKPPVHTTRSRAERRGKSYRKSAELIDNEREYTLKEALDLAVKSNPSKFDATVELHVNLSVDPRQADQNIRDSVALPAGTGKTIRIAVLTDDGDDTEALKKAGASIVGSETVFAQLDKETVDFDILIATPSLMPKLGKYARFLGPKGLMPNPKSGTITKNTLKAVKEAKGGRVEYRVDSTGIVHLAIGKVSFGAGKLLENTQAVLTNIRAAKPASLKSSYVRSVFVATTMGPSVRVALTDIS